MLLVDAEMRLTDYAQTKPTPGLLDYRGKTEDNIYSNALETMVMMMVTMTASERFTVRHYKPRKSPIFILASVSCFNLFFAHLSMHYHTTSHGEEGLRSRYGEGALGGLADQGFLI